MPKYISQHEFAKRTGLGRSTVRVLVKNNRLKTVPYSVEHLGIDPAELKKWQKKRSTAPRKKPAT